MSSHLKDYTGSFFKKWRTFSISWSSIALPIKACRFLWMRNIATCIKILFTYYHNSQMFTSTWCVDICHNSNFFLIKNLGISKNTTIDLHLLLPPSASKKLAYNHMKNSYILWKAVNQSWNLYKLVLKPPSTMDSHSKLHSKLLFLFSHEMATSSVHNLLRQIICILTSYIIIGQKHSNYLFGKSLKVILDLPKIGGQEIMCTIPRRLPTMIEPIGS